MLIARAKIPTSLVSETTKEIIREVGADAPEIFGLGLDTITNVALGGGAVATAIGAIKLARRLFQRNRKRKGDSATECTDPFPRRLVEARQHRESREFSERRVPEYDAAVGRIFDDEYNLYHERGSDEDRAVLKVFRDGMRDRVDNLMPPSTREYIEKKG